MLPVRFELTKHTTFEVAASSNWATGAKICCSPSDRLPSENQLRRQGLNLHFSAFKERCHTY
jgi:hypothetical protein